MVVEAERWRFADLVGGRDRGLWGAVEEEEEDGRYSSSDPDSSVSRALEMVSAAALAVFRLGRGEVGNDASGRVAGWQFMIWGSGFANLFWDRRREFPMKIFSPI